MTITIRLRRGTAAQWSSANPVLGAGEAGFETDTNVLKIGDGVTAYNSLSDIGGAGGATNLSWTAATRTVASDTGTDAVLTVATGADAGLMTAADFTKLAGVATGATANASDAALRDRSTHTGTQLAATVSDFSTAADARIAAASVNALSDVTVTAPSSGQVLKWNGSAWVNDTDSTGGGGGAPQIMSWVV
jgi:hypothetical protein